MKKLTPAQRRLLAAVAERGPVMEHLGDQMFTLANGAPLHARTVRNCIHKGLLVASDDGLPGMGVTQTFHVAT